MITVARMNLLGLLALKLTKTKWYTIQKLLFDELNYIKISFIVHIVWLINQPSKSGLLLFKTCWCFRLYGSLNINYLHFFTLQAITVRRCELCMAIVQTFLRHNMSFMAISEFLYTHFVKALKKKCWLQVLGTQIYLKQCKHLLGIC